MKSKSTQYIIAIVVLLVVGFFIGRSTIDIKTKEVIKIEYQKSPYAVHDTIRVPEPYEVIKPVPYEVTDTLWMPVDTAAILADYFLKRKYKLDFSNDTIGTFIVDATVNQNKLITAISTIQPVIRTVTKEKTIYKVPTIQLYGIIGSSLDMKTNKLQLGLDFKQKYLIGVSGIRMNNTNGYTIDFGIKF